MAHLEMEEVGFDDWLLKIDKATRIADEIAERHRPFMGHFSDNGLTLIPTTCVEWSRVAGYEHEKGVKWFSIGLYSDGRELRKQSMGSGSYFSMMASIMWNAALYIHFTRKPIHIGAAEATAARFLKLSNIGGMNNDEETVRQRIAMAAKAAGDYVNVVLATAMDSDGLIGEGGLDIIKENNSLLRSLQKGRCVNKALRNRIADSLVADGIGQCATRDEQERMLCRYVARDHKLKGGALRAIRRRLAVIPRYMDEGVSPLIPYDFGGDNPVNMDRSRKADQRFAELLEDIEQGHAMTSAERRFVCTYLKKNPDMRTDLEEARETYRLTANTEKLDRCEPPRNSLKEYVMVGVPHTRAAGEEKCPKVLNVLNVPNHSPIFPQVNCTAMKGCNPSKKSGARKGLDRATRIGKAMLNGEDILDADRKFMGRWLARNPDYAGLFAQNREHMRMERKRVIKERHAERKSFTEQSPDGRKEQ